MLAVPIATAPGELFPSIMPWLLALLLLIIGGAAIVLVIRRWLDGREESPASMGFTLHDLREMHRSGAISDDEFERAKAAMIQQVKRAHQPTKDEDEAASTGMLGDDGEAPMHEPLS